MIEQAIEAVLEEAHRYLGVEEKPAGSNRGIEIDYWNWEAIRDWRPFPMGGQGAPWCTAFISQIGIQALGRQRWPVPATAIAQAVYEWGDRQGIAVPLPHRGDLFALYYPVHGRYGHVGFVTGVGANSFTTIEGNTNPGGSREGYGVFERKRPVTERTAFIRWAAAIVNP